jgi:hypothetical protein
MISRFQAPKTMQMRNETNDNAWRQTNQEINLFKGKVSVTDKSICSVYFFVVKCDFYSLGINSKFDKENLAVRPLGFSFYVRGV